MLGTWAQITAEHVQFRLICVIDRCSWQIMLTRTWSCWGVKEKACPPGTAQTGL